MTKINISKCIEKIENRFELVLIASKRAKDILEENLNSFNKNNKSKVTILALKEIEENYNINLSSNEKL